MENNATTLQPLKKIWANPALPIKYTIPQLEPFGPVMHNMQLALNRYNFIVRLVIDAKDCFEAYICREAF